MVVKGYQNINDNSLGDTEIIQDYSTLELPPLDFGLSLMPTSLGQSVFPTMDSLLLGSSKLAQNVQDFGLSFTGDTNSLLGESTFPTMDSLLLGSSNLAQDVQDFGLSFTGDTNSLLGESTFPTMDSLLLGSSNLAQDVQDFGLSFTGDTNSLLGDSTFPTMDSLLSGSSKLAQDVQDFGLSFTGDTNSLLGDSTFPTMDSLLSGSSKLAQDVQDFALSLEDVFAEPSENYYSGNEDYSGSNYSPDEYTPDEYTSDEYTSDEYTSDDGEASEPQHQNGTSVAELQAQIDEAVANGETEIVLDETVYIGPGEVLDGKGLTFVASKSLGDGGQSEGQDPMFEVNGGTLKNMHLTGEDGNGAADGIHAYGDEVTIDNVHFDNVGEDAITAKDVDTLNISNSSFTGATDKVIQVNCAADITIDNVKSYGHEENSKFLRINGGHTYPGGTILITNSDLDNPEAIIGIDDEGQGYTITFGEGNNFNNNLETKFYSD